ncbi:nickel-dependent hydrogenase large subunit [Hydrogenobacter thermophilus]|uniref:nickel-dependent hydrogenase large subunit n=1 Tax=Hydrogenobacter thermophilus TaxID=940 RepID=UPI0030F70927
MKVEKRLLARVEGTAELELIWKDGHIYDAKVRVASSRGIERVLEGRPFMDALAITPRVCGICGHAHLMACVKALEDAIGQVKLSQKAKLVRDITLMIEMVQNHIKWFYLFVMPDFIRLGEKLEEFEPFRGKKWKSAISIASEAVKIIAIFGGQWPHSSYAVPGGITSNFTNADLSKALSILDKVTDFFLEETVGMSMESFQSSKKFGYWEELKGDVKLFAELCAKYGLDKIGLSYGRFLTGGEVFPCISPGHFTGEKKLCSLNISKIKETDISPYSGAKVVRYNGLPYETGPLSRQFLSGNPFIKRLYKIYRDSYMVRVLSRLLEIWELIDATREKLLYLYALIKEPSYYTLHQKSERVTGEGIGIVEAARGTLIHNVRIEKGTVIKYDIITPSVWNLGPRCERYLGVAERAMIGLKNPIHAEMVLRSFDACSVCTTH